MAETVRGFKEILEGKHDAVAEGDFYMKGGIDEVKAELMEVEQHGQHAKLEIVTPEGTVYSEDVEMVTLPGVAGQIGVYPQHVPLMTQMVPGEIIVRKDGRDMFLATGEGLIEVTANRVSVLTDLAVAADKIDEAKAEEARQTRRSPAARETLRRGSGGRQCLARSLAGPIARQATSTPVRIPNLPVYLRNSARRSREYVWNKPPEHKRMGAAPLPSCTRSARFANLSPSGSPE